MKIISQRKNGNDNGSKIFLGNSDNAASINSFNKRHCVWFVKSLRRFLTCWR